MLKKSLVIYNIMLVMFLLVSGCETDNGEDNGKGNENVEVAEAPLLPLHEENMWVYEVSYANNRYDSYVTTTAYKQYTLGGVTGFSPIIYTEGMSFGMLQNDKNGDCIAYQFKDDGTLDFESVFLKKNIAEGETWIWQNAVYSDGDYSKYRIEEFEVTCIVSDTLISVPKGEFHCIGFQHHPGGFDKDGNPSHTYVEFYAENVGLVKFLHYKHDGTLKYLFSEQYLIEYNVKLD